MASDSISGPATRYHILTVDDGGDLTLSLALARAYGNEKLDLVASTLLSSKEELVQTYLNAGEVLRDLEERSVPVLFGVDATNLNSDETWDTILFHHLHLASSIRDEQVHAHHHYVLLAHYFFSAKSCLRPGVVVHVCLCGRQPQTWRVL
jgi:inosine-uridine nucleoside N-ribohydrolase